MSLKLNFSLTLSVLTFVSEEKYQRAWGHFNACIYYITGKY